MKIIIVGCGKVGEAVTKALCSENHDLSVIDVNSTVIDRITYSCDVRGFVGSGVVKDTLEDAGATGADLLIATASLDEINLLACIMAKDLGTKRCIARVRDPEHNKQSSYLSESLGISMTVNPELLASLEVARLLSLPSAIDVDSFTRGRIDMAQIKLNENSKIVNRPLSEMRHAVKSTVLICAIQRPGVPEIIIPTGDFVPMAGDKIFFTGTHKVMSQFLIEIGFSSFKIKTVMIIGGGKISYYLANKLIEQGQVVKIIEKSKEKCLELSRKLPKATVILADGSDQGILEEEGLEKADCLVALTGIDEDNTIISLFAKKYGIPKIVTKINKPELKDMAETVGLESVISPKELTTEILLSYARSVQRIQSSAVRTIYLVADGKAEALEFLAEEGSRALNTPLMKMKTKKNLIIAGIIRQGRALFPDGNDMIKQGDLVIVVTTNKFISALDEILE